MRNNKGKFENVTKKEGLLLSEHTTGVTVADFDNNGFQDLLVIKRGDLIHANESIVYLNSKDSGFRKFQKHNIVSTELGSIGMAVETFDYNQDGKVDVVLGNERGKWHLFKNELSEAKNNNYITVEVGNSKAKKTSALGATIETTSCGNTQIQRVGTTGAQYSLSHNNFVHFGLSNCASIKVKVTWTNRETETKTISTVNTNIKIGN